MEPRATVHEIILTTNYLTQYTDTTPLLIRKQHNFRHIIHCARKITWCLQMASQADQELLPEQTAGFKVGEKKTMDQIQNMGI